MSQILTQDRSPATLSEGQSQRGDAEVVKIEELLYGRKGVRLQAEHRPHLRRVEQEATRLEAQRTRLANAVAAARDADVPFRAIAAAAQISHEQVRRMINAAGG
jgi:hypothetical protein